MGENHVRPEPDQFHGLLAGDIAIACIKTIVDSDVVVDVPPCLLKPVLEHPDAGLCFWIVLQQRHQHPDPAHALALLRTRRKRPRCRRAAKQRDELAPPHSITSSARASSVAGMSRLSAFAAFILITSSYVVGVCAFQ